MGERHSYAPGTICWVDLATTDPDGARAFYGELLGWEFAEQPHPHGTLATARRDGRMVAAIYPAAAHQPTAWVTYVSVEDADAAATRAADLGGTVLAGPFDVADACRTVFIQDPAGAVLAYLQPGTMHGAELVNAPGALCWNELSVPDPAVARDFYGKLLGWGFEDSDGFAMIKNGDALAGALRSPAPGDPSPPHWSVCFAVEEIGAATATAVGLGAAMLVEPTEMAGIGHFSVVADPQGAVMALYAGDLDP